MINNRGNGYRSVDEVRRAGLSDSALELLADAFNSIGSDRRKALWDVSIKDKPVAMNIEQQLHNDIERGINLPGLTPSEHVIQDYASMSLSLKAHPISFIREQLTQLRVLSASQLTTANDGDYVKVACLVLVRQRPGTASGICFITLEDETVTMNLVVWQQLF